MSWCNTRSGGPSPARASCIVTPPIGMVSVVQLPVDVLTVAKAPPSRGLEPHATPAQTTRFAQGLATMRFCVVAPRVRDGGGETGRRFRRRGGQGVERLSGDDACGADAGERRGDLTGRGGRRQPGRPAAGGCGGAG